MPQYSKPYPLTPEEIANWSASRTEGIRTGASKIVRYQDAGKPRLDGWKPLETVNASVGIRLINQFDGQGARAIARAAREFRNAFPAAAEEIDLYPGSQLHTTIAYTGLFDLSKYGVSTDLEKLHTQELHEDPDWTRFMRAVNRDQGPVLRQIESATKSAKPFTMRFEGLQVLGNSIVAKSVLGGEALNELTLKVRQSAPSLIGNDPTISPLDKSADGSWGMAGHTTVAIFRNPISPELAAAMVEWIEQNPMPPVDIDIECGSMDLQTWVEIEGAGDHFTHIAEVQEFPLGRSALALEAGR